MVVYQKVVINISGWEIWKIGNFNDEKLNLKFIKKLNLNDKK